MANHKSSLKRIRSTDAKRLRNRYQAQTVRNSMKILRAEKDKKVAGELFLKLSSQLDKLAKKNVIHKKKASNLKSSLAKLVNAL